MAQPTRRWRTALTGLLAALALPTVTLAAPAFAAPVTPPAPTAKIEAKVLEQLADDDKAVYWVQLNSQAVTVDAQRATTKAAKAEALFRSKTAHADATQANLRGLLDAVRADYRSYWIVNAIRVTGDRKLLDRIAEQPEVASIRAEQTVKLDEIVPGTAEPKAQDAVEWNIDRIGAPRVWDELGDRGEGIVVANIDSGVDYTHPAVNAQYRGRSSDGVYSHDYNWFDPANVCPAAAPCDNNDHGTHTMGTMVGSAGADRIGVAPGARWIAAKGCETNSCSDASLLAAGQWVIAPTDRSGNNPRPDLAPDVVNNSWGGTLYDDWYRLTVQAWVDAGIFPAFSNGNSGPGCNTNGYPGGYTNGYSSGSFNSAGAISSFSSRGPGESGRVKPDLAAPGENVRSSVPGAGYAAFSGTSMASPHTAATVALIWAYSPSLRGNVAETRALLDRTAVNTDATACGGTAEKNNIFGEGKLDAYAAVSAASHGPVGTLTGRVTSGGTGLAGATVLADGAIDRTAVTAADGSYSLANLAEGSYTVTVTKYGYQPATSAVTVVADQTVSQDFAVEQAPSATVTGTVRSGGTPAAGSVVTVAGTPVSATTDAVGQYRFTLPLGEYDVTASSPYRCADQALRHLSLTGDTTADIELPVRTDTFGYSCAAGTGEWVGGSTKLALTGDTAAEQVRLPFAVPLYGGVHTVGYVSTDGVLSFPAASTVYSNGAIPSPGLPNGALYPLWDDLYLDANSGVYTASTGAAPNRAFVVEWRNVAFYSDRTQRLSFSVTIGEDGSFTYRYKDTAPAGLAAGSGATIGLENATGTDALQYSLNTAVLSNGLAVTFRPVRTGLVRGTVTDANDGKPLAGAAVKLLTGTGATAGTATSGEDGGYLLQPAAGDYRLETGAADYTTATGPVTVTAGAVQRPVTALATGRVTTSVPTLTAVVPAGQTRTRTFELANSGAPTAYTVTEAVDAAWLKVEPAGGDLGTGARQTVKLSLDTVGSAPGTVLTAQLLIRSASGRAPQLTVPVTVVVPGYQVALDAGATGTFTDSLGDSWTRDREYATGGYGYQGRSSAKDTRETITGTTDPKRFQTAREGMYGYAFDRVPNGVYTVELDFAELDRRSPDTRVFDVLIEDKEVIPDLDIALKAGIRKALTQTFTVTVTDGRLDVRFVASDGKTLLNAIRVTQRPDLTA